MNTIVKNILAIICMLAGGTAYGQYINEFAEREDVTVKEIIPIGSPLLSGEYHVTSTQTWDFNGCAYAYQNIVIDSGARLTIKNTVIAFPPNNYLKVKAGGVLIMDSCRFTNAASNLTMNYRWSGVQVGGNPNSGKSASLGKIVMTNSTIERAYKGIRTYLLNELTDLYGGVVSATNSRFKDNYYDAELVSFPDATILNYFDGCSFNKCTFEISVPANFPGGETCRVSLAYRRDVRFNGCTFNNQLSPISFRSYGIASYKSTFTVSDYCDQSGPAVADPCPESMKLKSSFYNFDYGIYADGGFEKRAFIRNSNFYNNKYGAKLVNMEYPDFSNCEVRIGAGGLPYGLYLNMCKYYKIQNNTFLRSFTYIGEESDKVKKDTAVGIYVTNSGAGDHKIYRNNFQGLTIGICPQLDNSGENNYTDGLKINCNRFQNCNYDIVMLGNIITPATVNSIQGWWNPSKPDSKQLVRNEYGATCGVGKSENKWHIDYSNKDIIHYCLAGTLTAPIPQPACSDFLLKVYTISLPNDYANLCPNEFDTGFLIDDNQVSTLKSTVNEMESLLNSDDMNLRLMEYNQSKIMDDGVLQAGNLAYNKFELHGMISEKIRMGFALGTEKGQQDALMLIATSGKQQTEAFYANEMLKTGNFIRAKEALSTLEQENPAYGNFCKRSLIEMAYRQQLKNNNVQQAHKLLDELTVFNYPELKLYPQAEQDTISKPLNRGGEKAVFSVYPNPAQDYVSFRFNGDRKNEVMVEIRDVNGNVLDQMELTNSPATYHTSKLVSGTYFAVLKVNGTVVESQKFILTK